MNKKFIEYIIVMTLFIPFFNLGKKEYVGVDKFIYLSQPAAITNINDIPAK